MGTVAKNVSVEQLLELKFALQQRVATEVASALAEFKSAAGFTPSAVDVYLVQVHHIGEELPDYVVGNVTARLDVLS